MKNKNIRSPRHAQMLRQFKADLADGLAFPKPHSVIVEGSWSDLPRSKVGISNQDRIKIKRKKERVEKWKHLLLD
jgi:hypothetical protein